MKSTAFFFCFALFVALCLGLSPARADKIEGLCWNSQIVYENRVRFLRADLDGDGRKEQVHLSLFPLLKKGGDVYRLDVGGQSLFDSWKEGMETDSTYSIFVVDVDTHNPYKEIAVLGPVGYEWQGVRLYGWRRGRLHRLTSEALDIHEVRGNGRLESSGWNGWLSIPTFWKMRSDGRVREVRVASFAIQPGSSNSRVRAIKTFRLFARPTTQSTSVLLRPQKNDTVRFDRATHNEWYRLHYRGRVGWIPDSERESFEINYAG